MEVLVGAVAAAAIVAVVAVAIVVVLAVAVILVGAVVVKVVTVVVTVVVKVVAVVVAAAAVFCTKQALCQSFQKRPFNQFTFEALTLIWQGRITPRSCGLCQAADC